MGNNNEMIRDNLIPTFLYIWKGIRLEDEERYHSHDHIEMAFIMAGRGAYRIDDVVYEVEEGDVLLLNPGVRHQALVPKKSNLSNPAVEFFIGFSDIHFEGMEPNHFMIGDGSPIYRTGPDLRLKIFKLCACMWDEQMERKPERYFMLRTYLEQILLLLLRENMEPVSLRKEGYAFESVNKKYVVEQIIDYFETHYSEKISLDQIAENMYLSSFYISKIFKSETGDTPIRHLIDIRLDRAKKLLESGTEGSIQEVASMVGYDDAYHFSKLFKKKYGISPSQVRRAD